MLDQVITAGKQIGEWMYWPIKSVMIALGIKSAVHDYSQDVANKEGLKSPRNFSEENILEEPLLENHQEEKKTSLWQGIKSFFNKTIDVIIGPSTSRLISIGCLAGLYFSPLSVAAITLQVGITVAGIGTSIFTEGLSLRNLRKHQKEELSLEKLIDLRIQKLSLINSTEGQTKLSSLYQELSENQPINSALDTGKGDVPIQIKNAFHRMPESLIPICSNAIALASNPTALAGILTGIATFSLTTTVSANLGEQKSFSLQRNILLKEIENNKNLLGLHYTNGKGLDFLKEQIKQETAELEALTKLSKTNNHDAQSSLSDEFKKLKEEELKKTLSHDTTLETKSRFHYVKKAFLGSFSYDKSRETFSPVVFYNSEVNKVKKECLLAAKKSLRDRSKTLGSNIKPDQEIEKLPEHSKKSRQQPVAEKGSPQISR